MNTLEIITPNRDEERYKKQNDLKVGLVAEASDEEVNIELAIRERFSMSQELALHRKKLMGTVDADEWNDYCAYVQECVEKAREQ